MRIKGLGVLRGIAAGFKGALTPKARKTLGERRDERLTELSKVAEVEEAQVRELEARLEFKRREAEVLGRISAARQSRARLWEQLAEYGIKRFNWRTAVIVGGLLVFIVLLFKC